MTNVPSVCLNMIVKNESHIIERTLEMLCSKIYFSYWVICDTGSTDDTCNIIKTFFKKKILQANYMKMSGKISLIIERWH